MARGVPRSLAMVTMSITAEAYQAVAGMFDELDATILNMVAIPPGAGQA
jgi:hypothetical protein